MAGSRFARVIKHVKDAEEYSRTGAVVLGGGEAAIYFLWGEPTHAYLRTGADELVGDPAIEAISAVLVRPGAVVWRTTEVAGPSTLRCTSGQLIERLGAGGETDAATIARLGDPTLEAVPRRHSSPLRYDLGDFPLLPSGLVLWAGASAAEVRLDTPVRPGFALLAVFEGPDARAVAVVRQGQVDDALLVDPGGASAGIQAWGAVSGRRDGLVTACEIDDELAQLLPILWRSRIVHRDLDKRWLDGHNFLAALAGDGGERAVIVATPADIGIAVFVHGHVAAAYTARSRFPVNSLDAIVALFADPVVGTVTVIERRVEDVAAPLPVEPPAEAPAPDPVAPAGPAAVTSPPAPVVRFLDVAAPLDRSPGSRPPLRTALPGAPSTPSRPFAGSPGAAWLLQVGSIAEGDPRPPARMETVLPIRQADRALASSPVMDSEPPPVDFELVFAQLATMGKRFVGPGFATIDPILAGADRSPAGVREVIRTIRDTPVPGHTPAEISNMARAMLGFVADRVTAA